jgi:hypothetical protein
MVEMGCVQVNEVRVAAATDFDCMLGRAAIFTLPACTRLALLGQLGPIGRVDFPSVSYHGSTGLSSFMNVDQ